VVVLAGGGPAAAAAGPANTAEGKELFTGACVVCHGDNGKGGTHGGAPLTTTLTHDAIIQIVTSGRNQMPGFGSALRMQDREDLAAYVLELAAYSP
jgi:mono/diheme cytochrome c family protein